MLVKSFVSHALIFTVILAQELPVIAAASESINYAVNLPADAGTRQLIPSTLSHLGGQGARQRRQINLPADPFFDLTAVDYQGKTKKYINVVEAGLVEADKIKQVKSVKNVKNLNEVGFSLEAPKKLVNVDLRNQLKYLIADEGAVLAQVAPATNAQQPAPLAFMRATMNSGLRRR